MTSNKYNDIFSTGKETLKPKGILRKDNYKTKRLEVSFAKKMINDEEKLRLKHSLEFANSKIEHLKAFIEQLRSADSKCSNSKSEFKNIKAHTKELEESYEESKKENVRLHRQITFYHGMKPKLEEATEQIKELKTELRHLREENKDLERDRVNYMRDAQVLRSEIETATSETMNALRDLSDFKDKLPQCSVCLEDIFTIQEDDSRSILITQCGHLICSNDLEEWTNNNSQEVCPAGCGSTLEYTTKLHI